MKVHKYIHQFSLSEPVTACNMCPLFQWCEKANREKPWQKSKECPLTITSIRTYQSEEKKDAI